MSKKETPKKKWNLEKFTILLILLLTLLASPFIYLGCWFYTPVNIDGVEQIIEIKKGGNRQTISSLLKEKGIINSAFYYNLISRFAITGQKAKAGEYILSAAMSPSKIMGKISTGQVYMHQITIPEGYNMYEIASILEKKGLADREKFIEAATDKEFIKTFSLGDTPSLEGYLFPNTYLFIKGTSEKEIAAEMVNTFKKLAYNEIMLNSAAVGLTPHQVVNLASLVEKETSITEEKKIVSSVFHNRLKKKMRLQCDPTVIYSIKNFDGNIRKKDLMIDSPYNTYRYAGLPIGPIANPGLESIRGVLYPIQSNYFYFVATKQGGHYFSSTLEEHNRAVRKYQLNKQ